MGGGQDGGHGGVPYVLILGLSLAAGMEYALFHTDMTIIDLLAHGRVLATKTICHMHAMMHPTTL